jgi:hypothetical protein
MPCRETIAKILQKSRLKYLNLLRIKQLLPTLISILHRISGARYFDNQWMRIPPFCFYQPFLA